MKVNESYSFPCGTKITVSASMGWLDIGGGKMKFNLADCICPLHGKACKVSR